jgi:predicted transposase YbfD/YdcC
MKKYNFMDYRTKEDIEKEINNIFDLSNNEKDFEIEVEKLWNQQQILTWKQYKKIVNSVCWIF